MRSKEIGWAVFFNDTADEFSDSFQLELSNQLMTKFNAMVEIQDYATKGGFVLHIGFTDLKTVYQDGYSFALVEVITRMSMSKIMTAYWKSLDGKEVKPSEAIKSEEIDFGWCADFETDYFKRLADSKVLEELKDSIMNFRYFANFSLFPDLCIKYGFDSDPSEDQLQIIQNLLKSNFKDCYVSDTSKSGDHYLTMLDFEGNGFDDGLTQINQFIRELNVSQVSESLLLVEIE